MALAKRMKRVLNIDVSICPHCGCELMVLACMEDQPVNEKILKHLQSKGAVPLPSDLLPAARASPYVVCFV
jgi:hypothetical protein